MLGEAWVAMTEAKISFSGRGPSKEPNDLDAVGQLRHASILEEELHRSWIGAMRCCRQKMQGELHIWLQDVRFMVKAAHFSLMNRRAQASRMATDMCT